MAWASWEIVEYSKLQSTLTPMARQSSLKACSSRAVSSTHSSMKFFREMATLSLAGFSGGRYFGS